ncbi:MAG: DNA polymerase domain-containing protein [Deltaproteobacteria bacterium]
MGDEWLSGWDAAPGIVSVWAEPDGRVILWRRADGTVVREDLRFRPWVLTAHEDDLRGNDRITYRELAGDGALRWLARADDLPTLTRALLQGAARRLGHELGHVRELGDDAVVLAPDEQYLVASGRTYFGGLAFDDLRRMQIDLETTGLDPDRDRIFLIAVRDPDGRIELLEGEEPVVIARLVERVRACDPDVIENHNLHGFDIAFLQRRAERLRVPLELGRVPGGLRQRGARRGSASGDFKVRFIAPGRELIDTMDAVMRHDFSTRELPGHGLKQVAKAFGIAADDRELIRGDRIHAVYATDPERVRRYASADVEEVAQLSRMFGGAAFALATMVPRRYERLADAGAATGVLDPLLVRAYLRSGTALPRPTTSDGTEHSGAALHLFAAGVAERIVKADVASLYPSLMRSFQIGPSRDTLGALLAIVDRLVQRRLAAKAAAKAAPAGSAERHTHEAMSAAMKLVVNSAYGYLGAPGLTRFADVHAANEVTRRGREVLDVMCKGLAARGVTLLEADTDGVYFAVPAEWNEVDERRVVAEVGALLPELVQLEYEGRYAAMLSHEPKNYALLGYSENPEGGKLVLRGVAFRSSRAEPFGEAFLREAVGYLLRGDVGAVHRTYLAVISALRERTVATYAVSSRVRLTKTPAEYQTVREARRELTYEALLAAGRTVWTVGERVRVYRTAGGGAGLIDEDAVDDARDYDVEHYVRLLRETFASRLARAFEPDDFATLFDDPDQLTLFAKPIASIRPILTPAPPAAE